MWQKLNNRRNVIEKRLKRPTFFIQRIVLVTSLFFILLLQGCAYAFVLLFLPSYTSFLIYAKRDSKGMFKTSYRDHIESKRKAHLFSATSFGVILVSVIVVNYFTISVLDFRIHPALAVARTWDGGGNDNNWGTCANWTSDTCPGSGDVATFDATSTKIVTIEATKTVAGVDINSGYTGTITMASGVTLNVGTSNFDIADGTFTGVSDAILDTNSDIIISAGTLNAPGTIRVADDWTHTAGGTFNHQNGTVAFDSNLDGVLDFDPAVAGSTSGKFYNISVFKTTNWLVQVNTNDVMIIENDLTLTDGRFNGISAGSVDLRGNFSVASTIDGTLTNIKFSGSNAQTINLSGAETLFDGKIDVNKTGNGVTLLSDLTMNASGQTLTITNGTLDPNSKNIQVAGNYAQTGGTYVGTGTLDLDSNFSLTGGTFNLPPTFTLADDWVHTTAGTFNHNNRTVVFDGAKDTLINIDTTVPTSGTFYNITMQKTNNWLVTVNTSDIVTVENILTLTDGRLQANSSGEVDVKSNVTVGSGVDDSTSLLVFTGSNDQNFDLTGGEANYNGDVKVDKTGGTVTLQSNLTMDASGQAFTLANGTFNANGKALVVQSLYSQSGGTYNANGGSLDCNSDWTLTGGTFNAPPTITITDDWTHITAGTFNHQNGTVTFVDAVDSLIDTAAIPTSGVFYNLTMNKSNNWLVQVNTGDTVTTDGTLQLTDGRYNALTASNGTHVANGDVIVDSTIEAFLTTLKFSGLNTQNFRLTGAEALFDNDVSVDKTGGGVILGSDLTLNASGQDLTVVEGKFDINGHAITVNGLNSKLVIQDGGNLQLQRDETITANTNYPQLDSGSKVSYTATSGSGNIKDYTYHHLAINGPGGTFSLGAGETLTGDLTVTAGTFDVNDQTLSINGNTTINGGTMKTGTNTNTFGNAGADSVTVSSGSLEIESDNTSTDIVKTAGTWTNSGGTITYNAGTTVSTNLLSSLSPYYNLTIDSVGSTYTLDAAIDVDGTVTLTNGSLDVHTTPKNINVGGSWIDTGGASFIKRTGLVIFDGNGTINSNEAFYGFRVNTSGTLTLAAPLDVDNNFSIQSGTLDVSPSNYGITVGGNWANTGTFTQRSGTVTFDDVSKTSTISGNTTFHNLTSTTPAKPITFTASSTQTIGNTLTLTGTGGNRIILRSSSTDTRWNINVSGTSAVTYVDVKDSDASGGNAIDAGSNSANNGNNLNWIFNTAPTAPTTLYSNDTATNAQSGLVSPTNLTDETPNFTALYNDPDSGDIANKYCIQVNSASDFSGTNLWYSDSSSCNTGSAITNITAGDRSTDKEYAGSALSCNTTYYWRIRFWDDSNVTGAWSTAANFLINCAPTVNDASGSVNEDATYTGDLSHTDGDPDAATYSVVGGASNGTVNITNATTGAFTYTPNANYNGSDSFTYRVNDGTENSNTATFTITVDPINDVPSFTKGANQTVLEDAGVQTVTGWATGISSGPSNESGQTLTFNVNTNNDALFSSLPTIDAATGNLAYTSAVNKNGSATVTVSISDNGGTASGGVDISASQTFTITVNSVNDAPGFTKGADQTVNEDAGAQTVVGWATAMSKGPSDESGQTLSFNVGTNNDGLFSSLPTVNATTGNLVYTPAGNANGSATVTVSISDNGGVANSGVDTSASQTFTITVNAVNDAPTANAASFSTNEDITYTGTLTSSDIEGNPVTYSVVGNGAKGTATITDAATGAFQYVPNANANGGDSFTFKVNDGTVDSSTATVSVTITAVNDAPGFTKGADQTVNEDSGVQTVTGWATAMTKGPSNESGQTLSFNVNTNNDSLFSSLPTINATTGNLTYTPAANKNGSATVTVSISDNGGVANSGVDTSASQTFTITVNAVNDAPSFTKGTNQSLSEDAGAQTAVGWATAMTKGPSDESGQTLNFNINTNNDGLFSSLPTVNATTGNLSYTPAGNANGVATITVSLSDNGGTTNGGVDTSASQTFTITVTAVNDAPIANAASFSTNEDITYTGSLTASDIENDSLVYSIVSNGSKGTATITNSATGAFQYVPNSNDNGSDSFTFKVNDGTVDSNTATVSVTITAVNDTPIANAASFSTNEDTTYSGTLTGSDVEGSALTYSIVGNGAKGTATITDAATGAFQYVPNANANGSDSFTFKVNDGTVDSGTAIISITLTAVNDDPSFTKAADQTVNEDSGIQTVAGWATSITAGPSNESSQTLTFHTNTNNDALFTSVPSIDATTGNLTYTTAVNANGSAIVTVTISDNGGTTNGGVNTSGSQTFTITVNAVNDTPTANAGIDISANEADSAASLDGTDSSDIDGNALTYNWTELSDSSDGCSLNNPTTAQPSVAIFDRESNYSCVYSLTVNDGTADSVADNVTVNVTAENDPPTITSVEDKTVDEGEFLTFAIGANDADTDTIDLTVDDKANTFSDNNIAVEDLFTDNRNNTGTFRWTTAGDDSGSYQATFIADDDTTTVQQLVNITVNNANTAPTFSNSLPNIAFIAGNTTATVFDLDNYFSDTDTTELTYLVSGNNQVDVTIDSGAVTLSAPIDFAGTEELLFTAADEEGLTVASNIVVVTVTEPIDENDNSDDEDIPGEDPAPITPDEISYVDGTSNGKGVVTIYDNDGNVLATWEAFPTGGVIPSIAQVNDSKAYVFAIRKKPGSLVRVYELNGDFVSKKRISPAAHWRKMTIGNLDSNTETEEIVMATVRGRTVYFKVYSFKPKQKQFILKTRAYYRAKQNTSIKEIIRDLRFRVTIQKRNVLLRTEAGKQFFKWHTF